MEWTGIFSVLLAEIGFQVIGIDCAEGYAESSKPSEKPL
jgi:2-polyprenyl-3-methyl-5-hydroxy-6-metoxy-1,4-benzoquinol methylase